MRKLGILFLAIATLSCGEKESAESGSSNLLENFSFSVDTVIVDPGEEIINLSRGVNLSSLNESKTHFYLLDEQEGHVKKISLDQLVLEEIIPFEKEGPNGIGANYHTKALLLPGEDFLFTSFQVSGIFSKEGKLLKDLKIKPDDIQIEGMEESESNNLTNQFTLAKDRKTAFSLPGNFIAGSRKLVKMDLENATGKILPIPAMDIAGQFRILLESKEAMSIYVESINLQEFEDALYISAQPTNKIYRYDYDTDSMQLLEYDFQLVPDQKENPIQNKVSSKEEFDAQMDKALTQISFEKLLYDSKNERFYRFGRIYKPKLEGEDRYTRARVFLFAFDKELNLIGETEISELEKVPDSPFFKDGKLWSYVNVEDELGFAVFTFDF
ncbi:DUF4221 family protein [Algoriphagus vanfongensis]|uniref:DUF4221 family protein n=1 Tax=Algoriphagus vanfongensis TaxID=426371 RepID=UPI0004112B09|nr:DUF4221 family protein [Algoriphagus vanfongensis]